MSAFRLLYRAGGFGDDQEDDLDARIAQLARQAKALADERRAGRDAPGDDLLGQIEALRSQVGEEHRRNIGALTGSRAGESYGESALMDAAAALGTLPAALGERPMTSAGAAMLATGFGAIPGLATMGAGLLGGDWLASKLTAPIGRALSPDIAEERLAQELALLGQTSADIQESPFRRAAARSLEVGLDPRSGPFGVAGEFPTVLGRYADVLRTGEPEGAGTIAAGLVPLVGGLGSAAARRFAPGLAAGPMGTALEAMRLTDPIDIGMAAAEARLLPGQAGAMLLPGGRPLPEAGKPMVPLRELAPESQAELLADLRTEAGAAQTEAIGRLEDAITDLARRVEDIKGPARREGFRTLKAERPARGTEARETFPIVEAEELPGRAMGSPFDIPVRPSPEEIGARAGARTEAELAERRRAIETDNEAARERMEASLRAEAALRRAPPELERAPPKLATPAPTAGRALSPEEKALEERGLAKIESERERVYSRAPVKWEHLPTERLRDLAEYRRAFSEWGWNDTKKRPLQDERLADRERDLREAYVKKWNIDPSQGPAPPAASDVYLDVSAPRVEPDVVRAKANALGQFDRATADIDQVLTARTPAVRSASDLIDEMRADFRKAHPGEDLADEAVADLKRWAEQVEIDAQAPPPRGKLYERLMEMPRKRVSQAEAIERGQPSPPEGAAERVRGDVQKTIEAKDREIDEWTRVAEMDPPRKDEAFAHIEALGQERIRLEDELYRLGERQKRQKPIAEGATAEEKVEIAAEEAAKKARESEARASRKRLGQIDEEQEARKLQDAAEEAGLTYEGSRTPGEVRIGGTVYKAKTFLEYPEQVGGPAVRGEEGFVESVSPGEKAVRLRELRKEPEVRFVSSKTGREFTPEELRSDVTLLQARAAGKKTSRLKTHDEDFLEQRAHAEAVEKARESAELEAGNRKVLMRDLRRVLLERRETLGEAREAGEGLKKQIAFRAQDARTREAEALLDASRKAIEARGDGPKRSDFHPDGGLSGQVRTMKRSDYLRWANADDGFFGAHRWLAEARYRVLADSGDSLVSVGRRFVEVDEIGGRRSIYEIAAHPSRAEGPERLVFVTKRVYQDGKPVAAYSFTMDNTEAEMARRLQLRVEVPGRAGTAEPMTSRRAYFLVVRDSIAGDHFGKREWGMFPAEDDTFLRGRAELWAREPEVPGLEAGARAARSAREREVLSAEARVREVKAAAGRIKGRAKPPPEARPGAPPATPAVSTQRKPSQVEKRAEARRAEQESEEAAARADVVREESDIRRRYRLAVAERTSKRDLHLAAESSATFIYGPEWKKAVSQRSLSDVEKDMTNMGYTPESARVLALEMESIRITRDPPTPETVAHAMRSGAPDVDDYKARVESLRAEARSLFGDAGPAAKARREAIRKELQEAGEDIRCEGGSL